MAITQYFGTGRRKKSVARVRLVPGKGEITINKRTIDDYFGLETLKAILRQPLVATNTEGKFDVICNVQGGGFTGTCFSTAPSEVFSLSSSIGLPQQEKPQHPEQVQSLRTSIMAPQSAQRRIS